MNSLLKSSVAENPPLFQFKFSETQEFYISEFEILNSDSI